MAGALLIVDLVARPLPDIFFVERMFDQPLDRDDPGLFHPVADYRPHHRFLDSSGLHSFIHVVLTWPSAARGSSGAAESSPGPGSFAPGATARCSPAARWRA